MTHITVAGSKLLRPVADLARDEQGQDLVEYALLAALISIVAVSIIVLVGPFLVNLFQHIVNQLGTA